MRRRFERLVDWLADSRFIELFSLLACLSCGLWAVYDGFHGAWIGMLFYGTLAAVNLNTWVREHHSRIKREIAEQNAREG